MRKSIQLILIFVCACVFSLASCDATPGDNPTLDNYPCEHDFSDWVTVKFASCAEEGQISRTCKKCSAEETQAVSKTNIHTEVTDPAVAPTCTSAGKSEGKHCSVCSEILIAQTTVGALGHTEVTDPAVAPTCTAAGKSEGKHCSVCSEVLVAQTTVGALGHTEVTDPAVAPTCTAAGKSEGKHCSVCSEILVAQTTVVALGHTEVIDSAVAPTCTAAGKSEGKHCSVCSEVLVAQTTVGALGHTEVNDPERKYCLICKEFLEHKIYSFGVLSDIHVKDSERDSDTTDTKANYIRALNYYKQNSADFVCVAGDIIWNGSRGVPELEESVKYWSDEVQLFQSLNNQYFNDDETGQHVYATTGNHDASLRGYAHGAYGLNEKASYYKDGTMTGEEAWEDILGTPLNYVIEREDDVFIFVGMYFWNYTSWYKDDASEFWLKEQLETYKDRRVFLFFHLYLNNTFDNLLGNLASSGVPSGMTKGDASRFEPLVNSYDNVIWFSGHSHIDMESENSEAFDNPNVYQNGESMTMVHVPSCAFLRTLNSTETAYSREYGTSQGLWIDVYENKIVIKVIDFTTSEFLPSIVYIINTESMSVQ